MAKLSSTQIYGDLQVDGEIKNKATTTTEGVVQLNDAVNSTSTTQGATANAVKKVNDTVASHVSNTTSHITASERTTWNGKVNKSGDNLTGHLTFDNARGVCGKTTDGVAHNLAQMSSSNEAYMGTINVPIILASSVNPKTNIKGTHHTLYHTGNKPTPADIGAIPLSGSTSVSGVIRSNSEIQSVSATGFRIAYGNHGLMIRNDGTDSYFLLTASGDKYGTWNNLRPLSISNTTGLVTFGNGLKGTLEGNASTATKLQTARTISLTGQVNGSGTFDGSGNLSIKTSIDDGKRINASFATAYRTQTFGSSGSGGFVYPIRNDTASVANSPQYGSGVAFGKADTHGYLYVNYSTAQAFIGGGNADKLNWTKQLAFTDSSITGNASTATTLQTARTINGTSFNGSANITTANWGTARTLTIGNTGKSVNGSGNVSWSLNEMGASPGQTITGTTASSAQWYRIAQMPVGFVGGTAEFYINATGTNIYSSTLIVASVSSNQEPSIQQLSHSFLTSTGISQARVIYESSTSGYKAYLDVYVPTSVARTITVHMSGALGWSLVNPSTVGNTTANSTNKVITLVAGKIVADFQGKLTGNADTATTLYYDRTINGTTFKGNENITTKYWGWGRTLTIGNSGKSVDGSKNVSWSLSEIGAMPIAGGTITGNLGVKGTTDFIGNVGVDAKLFMKVDNVATDVGALLSSLRSESVNIKASKLNANDIVDNGVYHYWNNSGMVNFPSTVANDLIGTLVVFRGASFPMQLWSSYYGRLWYRSRGSAAGEWSPWERIGTSVTTNLSLLNGWQNYGQGFQEIKACKVGNMVTVNGLIKGGTTTEGTAILQLPTPYRPSGTVIFNFWGASGQFVRFNLGADGYLKVGASSGLSNSFLQVNMSFVVSD